jgi:hypothetical protein
MKESNIGRLVQENVAVLLASRGENQGIIHYYDRRKLRSDTSDTEHVAVSSMKESKISTSLDGLFIVDNGLVCLSLLLRSWFVVRGS